MRKITCMILMLFAVFCGFSEISTKVFFIKFDHESYGFGSIPYYASCQRNIEGKNILEETINALLKGLMKTEDEQEYYDFIPNGTKLLSADVKNGIAILNFSGEFAAPPNLGGLEGYGLRIGQLIYTVTELPNINKVQILINGKREEYLYEGFYIAKPLDRDSF